MSTRQTQIKIQKSQFSAGRDLDVYSWIIVFTVFIILLLTVYFQFVSKSLDRKLQIQLYSDTLTYEKYVKENPQINWFSLISFNGNYLGPVLIFKMLGQNRIVLVLFNILIVFNFIYSTRKLFSVNKIKLLLLLCINPVIAFSILSLNKEMLILLFLPFFLKYVKNKTVIYFILSLFLSLLVRWQLSLFFITYTLMTSWFNPWRKDRFASIVILILAISILYPIFSSRYFSSVVNISLESRGLDEGSGIFITMNEMQNKGLYFLVFVPKVLHLLFGLLLRIRNILIFDDFWNNVVVTGQSIPFLYLFINLFIKVKTKKINLSNEFYFLTVIFFIVFALTPIYAPRYFLPAYIILSVMFSSKYQPQL